MPGRYLERDGPQIGFREQERRWREDPRGDDPRTRELRQFAEQFRWRVWAARKALKAYAKVMRRIERKAAVAVRLMREVAATLEKEAGER